MEKLRNAFDNFSASFIKNNGGILKTGIAWINVSGFEKMPNKFKELLLLRLLVTIGGATWPSRKKDYSFDRKFETRKGYQDHTWWMRD
ncbi:MAG: hypothetical protein CM15mP62_08210 [Rhodospirillaceae bacterium]|nr:MAG: hypothetical protein CM15mP62_08210 [Rhodospirillaceae bacterium]